MLSAIARRVAQATLPASASLVANSKPLAGRLYALQPLHATTAYKMPEVAPGVVFESIAREWRCKWSPDEDKKSLVEAQKVR